MLFIGFIFGLTPAPLYLHREGGRASQVIYIFQSLINGVIFKPHNS